MKLDLKLFLRRIFTIPSSKRKLARELLLQEAERVAARLARYLVERIDVDRKPARSVATRISDAAEKWIHAQSGEIGRILKLLWPVLEERILREAEAVDETIEERLKQAIFQVLLKALR